MITVEHVYCTHVHINYYVANEEDGCLPWHLDESLVDTMDNIAEHVCEILVKHGFVSADVCSAETGEVLMIITRS